MNSFVIYPAIDLRGGRVVRLRQGRADQQTVYSNNPLETARIWMSQGAEWLHLVNLDGAFGRQTSLNEAAIAAILSASSGQLKVQLGGGLRTLDQVTAVLAADVHRVVVGTAAIADPAFAATLLERFGGERVAFGFDVLDGRLMTAGWQTSSGRDMYDLASSLAAAGATTLIYTNILRDGMQSGVDWQTAGTLACRSGLKVVASGGVAGLKDIEQVKAAGLAGVIVGQALYQGAFSLEEALHVR